MIDWLLSTLWYVSLAGAVLAMVALVKPLRRLGLSARKRGVVVLIAAIGLLLANATIVPGESHAAGPATLLDGIMPRYHFREQHTRSVGASAARVMSAIKSVTAADIALFQAFTAIRRMGRSGPESILNAPEDRPILEVATRTGFFLLAESDHEIVIGAIVAAPAGFKPSAVRDSEWFQTVSAEGLVKATMNFHIRPDNPTRVTVTTETRVFSQDHTGLRRFTPYWRTIFPGSWILRVTWLRAVARRAESGPR